MVKRKAEKQQPAGKILFIFCDNCFEAYMTIVSLGPVSAVAALAARRARQQQAPSADVPKATPKPAVENEPPSKKPRRSLEAAETTETNGDRRTSRARAAMKQNEPLPVEGLPERPARVTRSHKVETQLEVENAPGAPEDEQSMDDTAEIVDEMDENDVASVVGDADGYESPAETPAELQNFPLSKARLNKSNIVYSDESTLCLRLKERTVWVGSSTQTLSIILTFYRIWLW
jgi:polynucleotide 5'-hydroxyl-kinase GRC3/NOL9